MHVAVVVSKQLSSATDGSILKSQRDAGGWEAFLGQDRDQVIRKALYYTKNWGPKYQVWVGELTSEAVETPNYTLRRLE